MKYIVTLNSSIFGLDKKEINTISCDKLYADAMTNGYTVCEIGGEEIARMPTTNILGIIICKI